MVLRFAGLLDDDGEAAPPPASVYHGRASEPAFSLHQRTEVSGGQSYNGARSRDSSLRGGSRSRDNSYSGRSSRDSPVTGSSYSRRPGNSISGVGVILYPVCLTGGEVITEDSASNVLRGAADTDREKLETKTRTLLDEYLQVNKLLMAFLSVYL